MIRSQPTAFDLTRLLPVLSRQAWSCFLQSPAQGHVDNHYDIIVADPIATLSTHKGITQLCEAGQTQHFTDDPFALAQATRQRLFSHYDETQRWPFSGGAVGLWGYDLGRSIENIPHIAQCDLSTPDMALGFYDWALIVDKHTQAQFLLCHCNSDNAAALEEKLRARLAWLGAQLNDTAHTSPFALNSAWQKKTSRAQYSKAFHQVQAYLRSGDCYEINLTQGFSAEYEGDEYQAYLRLLKHNASPFSAFMRLPSSCILSLSPERFLQLKGSEVQTKPIKGTRARGRDPIEDAALAKQLQESEKDRAENLMIVDLLRNDIGRVAKAGSVRVPEIFAIESFPAVHHLVSTVTASLPDDCSAETLLKACFPGGSITGAPKIRAMEIIEELEPTRRNAYCGAIGYINNNGNMDTNIAIRTLVCENQRMHCWAGGAVVVDSIEADEYQECFDKLSRIMPILEKKE